MCDFFLLNFANVSQGESRVKLVWTMPSRRNVNEINPLNFLFLLLLVRIIDESEEKTPDYEERIKSQFPVIIIDSDQSDKS